MLEKVSGLNKCKHLQWKTGGVDNFDKSGGQQSKPTSARGQQGDTDVKVLARIGATEGAIRKV